jgi:hypothetical protein
MWLSYWIPNSQLAWNVDNCEQSFGLSIAEETLLVEMRIWCIKLGNPRVKTSAGGL